MLFLKKILNKLKFISKLFFIMKLVLIDTKIKILKNKYLKIGCKKYELKNRS